MLLRVILLGVSIASTVNWLGAESLRAAGVPAVRLPVLVSLFISLASLALACVIEVKRRN